MAEEQTGVSGLAGRYAKALFDLAREAGAVDAVAGDLARVRAMLDASADLRRMTASPLVPRGEQGAAMAELARRAGLGAAVGNFLALAARNRRLFALPGMIRAFDSLAAAHRGEVSAEVASARPLDADEAEAVRRALARAAGREVRPRFRVDPALIGGLAVRLGPRLFDASIRTRLQSLKAVMKGAA